jgi:hypothetical protein
MKSIFKGKVYADYYTFYLQDASVTPNYEALANPQDFEKMIAVGEQVLHITTVRYDTVPVSITLFEREPQLRLSTCNRANEASLHITTQLLLGNVISGFQTLALPISIYRVRVLYKNLNALEGASKAKDRYSLQLWREETLRETLYLK